MIMQLVKINEELFNHAITNATIWVFPRVMQIQVILLTYTNNIISLRNVHHSVHIIYNISRNLMMINITSDSKIVKQMNGLLLKVIPIMIDIYHHQT